MRLELTEERKAIIQSSYDEWLSNGLSTEPADFDAAEGAITLLYASVDKPKPHFVRLSSPLGAELYINLLTQTWPDTYNGDQLRGQLRGQLRDQLGGQLRDQLRKSKLRFMGTWFYGQWDYYWAYFDGMRRVGAKLDDPKLAGQLDNHLTIMKSIGWFYPFNDFVIMTDRPKGIKCDDEGRLHSENGPALKYRDGYELHALDGVRVPPEWSAGKFPPSTEILNLINPEQRAVACKYVGWHTMLEGLEAKLVDEDEDPLIGSLFRFDFETEDETIERGCLVYLCATGRIMSSLVSADFDSALAANAWMQGLDTDQLLDMETRA